MYAQFLANTMINTEKSRLLVNLDTGCGKNLLQLLIAKLAIKMDKRVNVLIFHASENVRDENYNLYTNDNNYCGKFIDNGKITKKITYLTMDDFHHLPKIISAHSHLMVILDEVEQLINHLGSVKNYAVGKNKGVKFTYSVA